MPVVSPGEARRPAAQVKIKEETLPARKTAKKSKIKRRNELSAANGLAIAMQTEIEGYEFYRLAAQKSKDAGAREMFRSLAKDEVEHYRLLKAQYDNIVRGGDFKALRKAGRSRLKVKSPVFSKAFLSSRKNKHFEMSALSVGILLEQNAIEFFKKQHQQVKDAKAKKLFKELADWEGEHLRALLAQKRFLQREIFAAAHFEPF
jgi:rubrerythrin